VLRVAAVLGRRSEPVSRSRSQENAHAIFGGCFTGVTVDLDLTFNAKDGKPIFELGKCDATDLCDLARQVDALANRLVWLESSTDVSHLVRRLFHVV